LIVGGNKETAGKDEEHAERYDENNVSADGCAQRHGNSEK
jgi:hypothetical protein